MQRTWLDRFKRIIVIALPFIVLALTIVLDQVTKCYFKNLYEENGKTMVIEDFFYFTYTVNTGAAWSFLSDVSWAQTFFKILTCVALIMFGLFMAYACVKKIKWLQYSLAFIIGGTIGNFIDRLLYSGVTDFLSFIFGGYYFPVFNLADSFLVVGVIMMAIYLFFLDENAIFKKSEKSALENVDSNLEEKLMEDSKSSDKDNGKENISDN